MDSLQSPLRPQARPWLRKGWASLRPQVLILMRHRQENLLVCTILDIPQIQSILEFATGLLDPAHIMVMLWRLPATPATNVFTMLLLTRDGELASAPIGFTSS